MRTRILLLCGAVLAFCLWFLLHHRTSPPKSEAATTVTNQQLASQPPQIQTAQNPTQTPSTVLQAKIPRPPLTTNEIRERVLADWQKPIEFYGKVIDENSNPLMDASIQFQWAGFADKVDTATTASDVNGLFSLQGKQGRSLDVSVSKEGYYNSRKDKTGFLYSLGPDIYAPEEWNPVIFHLHKKEKGESLIHIGGIGLHTMRDYLLDADGKPTEVSLRDGRLAPAGQGDLQVEFRAGESIAPSEISWWCRVTVPGGGLIQTSAEFPFLAPESGYQETDEWNITSTNWTEQVNNQYYVKLRDGNFGRVKLRVIGVPNRAYFRMESFVNPTGSQNLEPAQ